ncbi:MAG: DUF4328 domain-containing protein [Rhodospirillales bacterium]|nr:DUF4328 domain-containing protein [Rhodospirillales bacterium]
MIDDMGPIPPPTAEAKSASMRYHSARGACREVRFWLILPLVLSLLTFVFLLVVLLAYYPEFARGGNFGIDKTPIGQGFQWWALFVMLLPDVVAAGTILSLLVWVHAAYRNLDALRGKRRYTPAQAVLSFVVPVVQLYRPGVVAREIWTESDPSRVRGVPSSSWVQGPATQLPIWFAAFQAVWFVWFLLLFLRYGLLIADWEIEQVLRLEGLQLFSLPLQFALFWAIWTFVGRAQRRQDERFQRLRLMGLANDPTEAESKRAWALRDGFSDLHSYCGVSSPVGASPPGVRPGIRRDHRRDRRSRSHPARRMARAAPPLRRSSGRRKAKPRRCPNVERRCAPGTRWRLVDRTDLGERRQPPVVAGRRGGNSSRAMASPCDHRLVVARGTTL